MEITEEESLLLQCLASATLLIALENNNFLDSEYFKNLSFGNHIIKLVLEQSGLGNPAMMQIMFYVLLIVPKELLSGEAYSKMQTYIEKINTLVCELVEQETYSTYKGENNILEINYLRHIRNAVAHSKCKYFSEGQRNFVCFKDNNTHEECNIKIECYKVGSIFVKLQKLIIDYCNNEF